MIFVLLVAAGMSAQGIRDDEKPAALTAMVQARQSISSSDIRWSRTSSGGDGREIFYRSRSAANGDMAYEMLGDENGVLDYKADGSPHTITSLGLLYEADEGHIWDYLRGLVGADLSNSPRREHSPLPDLRTIGLANGFYERDWLGEDDVLHIDEHPHRFETQVVDGIHVVSAVADDNSRITWYINPEKGWNAERIVTYHREGPISHETILSLKQFGDTWFPETVVQKIGGGRSVIQIQSASFNDQAPLTKLTPTDIGVEPGVAVSSLGARGPTFWNGEKRVPAKEWFAAVESGEKEYGPSIAYAMAHGVSHIIPDSDKMIAASGLPNSVQMGAWEKYVNAFIRKHSLKKGQKQKALQILKQCQSKRNRYLATKTTELKTLKNLSSEKQRERMAALLKPVNEILEKQLKPRVAKLLTRAQRAKCDCHE